MYNQFPYDNISKQIAKITTPYSRDKFESIFQNISYDTNIQRVGQIDIQFELCDVYLISPSGVNQKYHPLPPAYLSYRIQAVLIPGNRRFYMLIHCGNDFVITNHTFNQTIAGMRTSPAEYRNIGPGRFIDNVTGNIISGEEDEFDIKRIIITNDEWLLNSDHIFVFSRNFFTV